MISEADIYDVKKADLQNFPRIFQLWRQAIQLKIITQSDRDRHRFISLAMHALRIGKKPGALFASNLHDRRWDFIAGVDEDHAREFMTTKKCPKIQRTPTPKKRGTQ